MEFERFCIKLGEEILDRNLKSKKEIIKLREEYCKKYKPKKYPSFIQIILAANKTDRKKLFKLLETKPIRSQSGVSVVAVMTKFFPCPHVQKGIGPCIMCPGGIKTPQSYTGKEPAARRGERNRYDAYLQIFNRLEQYILTGHHPEKIELILMGGTFPSFPVKYQNEFVKDCFKALNDFGKLFINKGINFEKFIKFFELDVENKKDRYDLIIKKVLEFKKKNKDNLKKSQLKNETANIRCVALVIETRPDYCKQKHINRMLEQGCTRVELGLQSVYPDVLEKIRRGHTIQDTIEATKLLKNAGLKVGYHILLGAPGSSLKKDLEMFKILFSDDRFKPDAIKIYPCMVMPRTKLYDLWKQGKYKPINTKQAASLIARAKKYIPKYCRIIRILRDIPTYITAAGVDKTNLRQYVEKELKRLNIKCQCIRCREAGRILGNNKEIKVKKIEILTKEYDSSNGKEFFISAEDKENNILFGLCRLRIPKESKRKEITNKTSIIRELHIYSSQLQIGKKSKDSYQHTGLGIKLIKEAEKISKNLGKHKIIVISGVGVKKYYELKHMYKKDGPYMSKKLN